MAGERCPGQDMRNWTPEDIRYVPCPSCGREVEIWRDEPVRTCRACGAAVRNPAHDPSCLKWCPHSGGCGASGVSRD